MKKLHESAKFFWESHGRRSAADFGPSIALFLAGIPIALDYGRTGRTDLLIGGLLVSLMGLSLADYVSGWNILSRTFSHLTPTANPIHHRVPLAIIGLATTFTLLIGESFQFIARHPLTPALYQDPDTIRILTQDPSFLKILATAFFFPAASFINLPTVHHRLEKTLSGMEIKCIQNLCGLTGASLIGMFGLMIGAVSALSFGVLCGFAHLMSFFIRSHHLEKAPA